jgi:FAD dependent oxidoreductase TIGR03364
MPVSERFDVAIAGAGILGLAHAYHFARAGLKVAVFERGPRATGASIRNFGMIWPIGQPPGEMLDVLRASEIWLARCGSIHLAYADDESSVLEEFAGKASELGYECALVSPEEVLARSPGVRRPGLRGGLWSPSELCVFPRQVVAELPAYLETLGVRFSWQAAVTAVESGQLIAGESTIRAERIFLCTGDDFETLFPGLVAALGMTRVKLQMLRAMPRAANFRLGPLLCAGLTLGHYANFRVCERLPSLLERFGRDFTEQVEWGIHLLVSQHEDGQLTIGDSHEYGLEVTPFLRAQIELLILNYLNTFLDASQLEITERWHGVYAKHPSRPYVREELVPGVHLVTGVGGAGMTLSFGLAERSLQAIGA